MIKLLIMDVDGTLTDGKIYINKQGECFKAFDIKDGYGIHDLLAQHKIEPVIITGRKSEIVKKRADELNVYEVYQGIKNKKSVFLDILKEKKCSLNEVAYIGDDLADLECMEMCISGCPADAVEEIKSISEFISEKKGGDGAVRDFIEWILKNKI